jgi:hypothetical protein
MRVEQVSVERKFRDAVGTEVEVTLFCDRNENGSVRLAGIRFDRIVEEGGRQVYPHANTEDVDWNNVYDLVVRKAMQSWGEITVAANAAESEGEMTA